MKKIDILLRCAVCLALFCPISLTAQDKSPKPSPDNTPQYRNASLTTEDRVADLLSRMTLEEKVQQICGGSRAEMEVVDPTGTYTTETARAVRERSWDPDLVFPARKAATPR